MARVVGRVRVGHAARVAVVEVLRAVVRPALVAVRPALLRVRRLLRIRRLPGIPALLRVRLLRRRRVAVRRPSRALPGTLGPLPVRRRAAPPARRAGAGARRSLLRLLLSLGGAVVPAPASDPESSHVIERTWSRRVTCRARRSGPGIAADL
ncbi:hypothetical protein Shyhy01_29870 [Streptomyces hygroscopicus subsp. hygroscopicus]|nr:hypothetical protein Shyhy01_29870 [Streptomyces hygroscopicus subsp. hygroscopicus]